MVASSVRKARFCADTGGDEPTTTTTAASSAAPRMHNRTKPIRYWVSIGNPQPGSQLPNLERDSLGISDCAIISYAATAQSACGSVGSELAAESGSARNVPLVPAQRDSGSKLLDAAPCAFAETRERGKEEGAFRPRRSRVPRHPFPSTGPAIRRPGTFRG